MNIRLDYLDIRTRKTTERIAFSRSVTFLHGPVSTGKSTVARLVDYCLGGDLERTPAVQQEFVAAELMLRLGDYQCSLERAAHDTQAIRVSWSGPNNIVGSVNAPLDPQETPLLDADVYNFSDLVFHLCGVLPIKVRQRARDPESPLVRLSIRDIWWYCYLDQTHLDSSFFRLEDPFRGRKSQDAMRFFTGLHSERLGQLEGDLARTLDEQRGKREAVRQIRRFMSRFDLGSEFDVIAQLTDAQQELASAEARRAHLEQTRSSQTHPSDALREDLRRLGDEITSVRKAFDESKDAVEEQRALRAELITAKVKAERAHEAVAVLEGVEYDRCPSCGSDISKRQAPTDRCRLCDTPDADATKETPLELEALRRDLNERIDQLADSVARRDREREKTDRQLKQLVSKKMALDGQLQQELSRYDSAFVESLRAVDREAATLSERIKSLQQLQKMPQAIDELEEQAGSLQGQIDRLRTMIGQERERLRAADESLAAIASEFKDVMLAVSFPGVSASDEIVIDPRNWKPIVVHGQQEWSFWDTGSGGKKTLFNVCYALAIHAVAARLGLPVPGVLVIDSPTKNISDDENPELVRKLYDEIYRIALGHDGQTVQFLLIDSDLVAPQVAVPDFRERRMAGEVDAPSLIPYYVGP